MQASERVIARIWDGDLSAMTPWRRRVYFAARIAWAVGRDVQQGDLPLKATSLVYTTLLSLVPLLAVSFSVLKGFGVQNEMEPLLLQVLEPLGPVKSLEVTNRIIGFVNNTNVGVLGVIGLAFLIYTVISLLQKVEGAFNAIWRIKKERTLARRFSDYLSVILIGPVLVFGALGLTATLTNTSFVERISTIQPFGILVGTVTALLPYVLVVCAFTFTYSFMPNTRVKLASAFFGGMLAGVLWATAGFLFAIFVADSDNYNAIYSAFATLIVFMVWLYVNWLILLVGGSVSFYYQNPDALMVSRTMTRLSNRVRERLALSAVLLIARSFYEGEEGWTEEALARRLQIPRTLLSGILGGLRAAGLVAQTAERPHRLLPGRPPDSTPIKAILDAARSADEGRQFRLDSLPADAVADRLMTRADEAVEAALAPWTVKDAMDAGTEPTPAGSFGPAVLKTDRQGGLPDPIPSTMPSAKGTMPER